MQAHQVAKEALGADPVNSKVLSLLATIEEGLKNYKAARKHFRAGHAINPDDATILTAWARMEAQCGNIQQAQKLFQQAYDLGHSNIVLLQVRASSHTLHCVAFLYEILPSPMPLDHGCYRDTSFCIVIISMLGLGRACQGGL